MKSSDSQLRSRGYLPKVDQLSYPILSPNELFQLLRHSDACQRTLAARLLSNFDSSDSILQLINSLKIEKKLYTKLEICNSLVSFGVDAVPMLIGLLGEVGSNQHHTIPKESFKKSSYPLPRDIAARCLIRIGKPAIPFLVDALKVLDIIKLPEAIDAIGFIAFYDQSVTKEVFDSLKDCLNKNSPQPLIVWKIVRALSGIPASYPLLLDLKQVFDDVLILQEIERSLLQIESR